MARTHSVSVALWSARTPVVVRSAPVASPKNIVVDISFNGHRAQAQWADSDLQLEYGWRGAIAIVSIHRSRGPAVVQVASTRQKPVHVNVRLSWH